MSINSVTSRIKEIQSQISLVKPRVTRHFSSMLNDTAGADNTESQTQNAAEGEFTALTPMQNNTSASILQALINNFSNANTSHQTVEFDPNCEECVAELAAKYGYVKADTLQTQSAVSNESASVTAPVSNISTTATNTAVQNTVQTNIATQIPTTGTATQNSGVLIDDNPNVLTLAEQEAMGMTTTYTNLTNQSGGTVIDDNPYVLTLEEQEAMQNSRLNGNPYVLTLEDQAALGMSAYAGSTAGAQLVPNSTNSGSSAMGSDSTMISPYTKKVVVDGVTITSWPGFMAYDPYLSKPASTNTQVGQTATLSSVSSSTVMLPVEYSCPVDYSVTLPAEYAGAAPYMDIIKEASARYGMPVNLIVGIMKAESNFDNACVSSSGAKGLMQLMPETAAEVGVTDVFDPRQNIFGCVEYITNLINKYGGDVRLALAAYNTGPGNIERKDVTNSATLNYADVPQSIRDYAERVLMYAGYVKTA